MKSILTVIGKDQVGIIAGISCELQKLNMNISALKEEAK